MADLIVIAVILMIVGIAIAYIIKEKKKGVKCIGCPAAVQCPHKCSGAGGKACAETSEICGMQKHK